MYIYIYYLYIIYIYIYYLYILSIHIIYIYIFTYYTDNNTCKADGII